MRGMIVTCVGYVAIAVAIFVLHLAGEIAANDLFLVNCLAILTWQLLIIAWIVLHDSHSRWPEANAWQRLNNMLSFRR